VTLRSRLGLAAVLLVAVLAAAGIFLVGTVTSSAVAQTNQELRSTARVAVGVADRQTGGSQPFPGRPSSPLSSHRPPGPRQNPLSDVYVAVIDGSSRRPIARPADGGGREPQLPRVSSSLLSRLRIETVPSVSGGGRWQATLVAVPSGQEVLVAVSMSRVDHTAATLRLAVLAAAGLVALVLLACGFWVERLGLRPIAQVRTVARAVLEGDRSRRVPATGRRTEADQLAAALNLMLDNQQEIEARLRQFIADASHELRTPTSVISGLAQLWRQGNLRDAPALEDAMRRIGQESARIGGLVEELLLLARLDEGSPLQQAPLDAAAVIRESLADGQATHPSRSVTATVEGPLPVVGDASALRRAVSNLLTNALVHTPPASPVAVRAGRSGDRVVVEVADGGPGMTADEAAHAFDRFWRGRSSRSRPGSGLGLSIVRAIVAAHGGEVQLETGPDRGTTVRLLLPAAPAAPPAAPQGFGRSAALSGPVSTPGVPS